jgi:cytochrome c peroxidase
MQNDRSRARLAAMAVLFLVLPAASRAVRAEAGPDPLLSDARQNFAPLPKDMAKPGTPLVAAQVELGRDLFFDPRISVDGTATCARCHQPALYGTDGLPKSRGALNKLNPRNAPTVFNAALEFSAHWVGDRHDVEDQAKQVLVGPVSFVNPDYASAIAKIKAIGGYAKPFREAFPDAADPMTPENFGTAVGAFERTLVTPSRFDKFLGGDAAALTPQEQRGLRKFIDTGCAGCHNGPGVGGGMFQKFGVVQDYWPETGSKEIDKGRFDVTHDPADMYVFKVPTLRNVAMTPPYFHDGSVAALPDAVRIMAKVQLGAPVAQPDIDDIVAFLNSLTGTLPASFAEAPTLPPAAYKE